MAARIAWVLNLDADLELAAGASYTPKKSVREAMRPHVERLAAALIGPDDLQLDSSSPPLCALGDQGRAFCPTPRALAILIRAGAEPEAHPPFEVLRAVNSRAFASSLGPTVEGAAFVTDLGSAQRMMSVPPELGEAWRVKRAFGMSGRGQRLVAPGPLRAHDLAFVRAGMAEGGVQIEPDLVIEEEYAIHGMLAASGSLRLGSVVRQRCDRRGAWLSTEPIADAAALGEVLARLGDEARRVAAALLAAEYFGPFGVDAYTYYHRDGQLRLQPRSEINARYSMGFAVGFGRI